MNEMTIGTFASLSIGGLALATFFYMWGGRHGKWKRRFIASLILSTTVCLSAFFMKVFHPLQLATYPALAIGFSLGYGADAFWGKVIRRAIYAASVISAGFLFATTLGGNAWGVLIMHAGVGVWSIYLGVRNPLYAAAEEVFICALLNLGLCMYPFIAGGVYV